MAKQQYVKPEDLKREILLSKENNELTHAAVMMLWKMAQETSKKLRYKDEEDRKDCISFAMEDILRYWRSYDPEKSRYPFAYYTQIIKNGFAKGWKKLHPISSLEKVSINSTNIYSL